MKKILLSVLLIASVNLVFSQTVLPCISDYKINNGGGNCPDTVLNGNTVTATGSVTLSFDGTIDANNIPQITGVTDITDPSNPVPIVDVTFGAGELNNNGTVTYCYYIGPNNTNNLLGANHKFKFTIIYHINGQTFICEGNIPLPVHFKSFTAARNHSNVLLIWETAFEQNNSGFTVERNIRGTWEQIGFLPSQSSSGNSETVLSYQYSDLNNVKGISQYRIKQIDFDAKSKYSEIRAVRGEGQAGKTIVYPNPSSNGKVNVIFEDVTATRDISVTDMNGRTIKQLKGVTNNNIQIDNLTPGIYSLRIIVRETGEQVVEKIVVNNR